MIINVHCNKSTVVFDVFFSSKLPKVITKTNKKKTNTRKMS